MYMGKYVYMYVCRYVIVLKKGWDWRFFFFTGIEMTGKDDCILGEFKTHVEGKGIKIKIKKRVRKKWDEMKSE